MFMSLNYLRQREAALSPQTKTKKEHETLGGQFRVLFYKG
jgi:hypothetical protein